MVRAAYPSNVRPTLPEGYLGEYQFGADFVFNPGLTVRIEPGKDGPVMRSSSGDSYLIPVRPLRFVDRLYGGTVTFRSSEGRNPELVWRFSTDYVARKKQKG